MLANYAQHSSCSLLCELRPAAHSTFHLVPAQCHRRQEDGKDIAYPVHAIAFHPDYGTFATGGGDGVVNVWDGEQKKRLFQIAK